jgi:hypothetical protein
MVLMAILLNARDTKEAYRHRKCFEMAFAKIVFNGIHTNLPGGKPFIMMKGFILSQIVICRSSDYKNINSIK